MQNKDSNDILFPFGTVLPGEMILIYGAGNVGRKYLKQIRETNYCVLQGFIDKDTAKKTIDDVKIYGIDSIKNIYYDHIVIALKSPLQQALVKDDLISKGVEPEKIISVQRINCVERDIKNAASGNETFAFKLPCVSVAIVLTGGLGDCIVTKKFLEVLSKLSSQIKIDFYTHQKKEDIYAIYRGESYLNEIFSDGYGYYVQNRDYYHVGINLGNFPEIEWLTPKEQWQSDEYLLWDTLKKIIIYREKYKSGTPNTHFMHYYKQIYLNNNFYSSLSCEGLVHIEGHKVHIPIDDMGKDEFEELKIKKYITINYGNGSSMEQADKINKQWPYRHFVQFVNLFKKKYHDIDIVQIGAANACEVENVDVTLLGKSLELIKHVLHGAIFHLDIEGGMVHLATQLGIKCIVLFGPTLEEFYAYEENINIRAGKCRGCWELYGADRLCAKNLPYPECMALITPEKVMEKVDEYLLSECKLR